MTGPEKQSADLPAEVIAALQAGRKIEAIKLLRSRSGLDLKASKEAVNAWCEAHPGVVPETQRVSGTGCLLWAVVIGGTAFGLWQYLN